MELRQTLIDMSNDARGWLRAWAANFNQSQATSSGGTKTDPIAWQLGHIASVEDDVYRGCSATCKHLLGGFAVRR